MGKAIKAEIELIYTQDGHLRKLGNQNNIVFPSELDNEIFEEKLKTLTESIRSKINKSPISYRAGMYGLKSDHVKILEKLGYKFDCSVTPLTDWRPSYKRDTAPDFRYCPQKEYYLDYNSLEVEGQSSIMEIPVTILFYRKILNTSPFLKKTFFKYKNNLITRLINKIFKT